MCQEHENPESHDEEVSSTDEIQCVNCGEQVAAGETEDTEIGSVCHGCFDEFSECNDCGRVLHSDNLEPIEGRGIACQDCVDEHHSTCDRCNLLVHTEDVVADGIVTLCRYCSDNCYQTCESCGHLTRNRDIDGGLCLDCQEEGHENDGEVIRRYSDRTASNLGPFGDPKDKTYYGIELECESFSIGRYEAAEGVLEALGDDYVVCKEDGSLCSERGFEIVTAPATISAHLERWEQLFANPISGLKSWDTKGACGMHVHVTRKALSPMTIGRMLIFINDPKNRWFIESIAGRGENMFCRAREKKLTDVFHSGDRYQAINLCNVSTVEFRIFRGTLNRLSFIKNLEFVAACVSFCRNTSHHQLDSSDFLAFVRRRRRDFPNLVAWLRENDHLPKQESSKPLFSRKPDPAVASSASLVSNEEV